MTTTPKKEHGQRHVTHLKTVAPIISLKWVKLGTSNFVCWLILRSTCSCIIDYLRRDVLRVTWPL